MAERTILALFDNLHQARRAVEILKAKPNLHDDSIHLLAWRKDDDSLTRLPAPTTPLDRARTRAQASHDQAREDRMLSIAVAATIGGALGTVAGLLVSLGQGLAISPALTTILGTTLGLVAGGLTGQLLGQRLADSGDSLDLEGIQRGASVVSITALDHHLPLLRSTLARNGATDMRQRNASFEATGWRGPLPPSDPALEQEPQQTRERVPELKEPPELEPKLPDERDALLRRPDPLAKYKADDPEPPELHGAQSLRALWEIDAGDAGELEREPGRPPALQHLDELQNNAGRSPGARRGSE